MAVDELHIAGYRSIRDVTLKLGRVNVVVGPNGSGKTNLYRGLWLIRQAAVGRLARTLAEEGGMPSALWAGPRQRGPVRLVLGFTSGDFDYELQAGLPPLDYSSMFFMDPRVKEEHVWYRTRGRRVVLLERKDMTVFARDDEGRRVTYPMSVGDTESVLAELREPQRYPELAMLREEVLSWRFYHGFRTDAASPVRRDAVATITPVLADDGSDLAAAIRTIYEQRGGGALGEAVDEAFPGARLKISGPRPPTVEDPGNARLPVRLEMHLPGIQRAFDVRELSDGTLQYLCLATALLTQRPPGLMALNEPETSIHPDLIPALARLIVRAGERSQMWVTTHSVPLAEAIEQATGRPALRLEKVYGATRVR